MPTIESHPLRIARIRAGLTAERLGELCGVSRGAINALEQGRIKTPRKTLIVALARENGMAPERLQELYDAWLQGFEQSTAAAFAEVESSLSAKARGVLALPPDVVRRYGSFKAWRTDIHPSVAGFASLLHVSATTLRRFEQGQISMPKPLLRALSKVLRLSDDYVEALMELDATDPGDVARDYWRDRKRVQRQREKWLAEGDPRGTRSLREPSSYVDLVVVDGVDDFVDTDIDIAVRED
jgi:transcriptional regulator with XRE-family HTH domain